ncbi:PEP-CTERM sorting domain-containing protein [Lacipirellula sp.]|uniref:PEP-CTERM sorting domain-containing protein n=1 Tax=Lacipirellula sp. TaxID=2691419 RepID=UPI003D1039B5
MKRMLAASLIACVAISVAQCTRAATVTVDPSASWNGYMNVSELPANGGAYVFGSGWAPADLVATFAGPVLTLKPNSVNDPATFWYQGGGGPGAPGNKIMAASMYVEQTGTLSGQSVTFVGKVLSNTFTSAHSTVAFIKDFAPNYSSNVAATVTLSATGDFSVTLNTINDPTRHIQFGFETTGVNVWSTDVAPFGNIQIVGVPEPATLGIAALGMVGIVAARRRRG